jgi:hypothetical protein
MGELAAMIRGLTLPLDLPTLRDVDALLHSVVTFLTSREFAVNFFANLGGAMAGVLLAF